MKFTTMRFFFAAACACIASAKNIGQVNTSQISINGNVLIKQSCAASHGSGCCTYSHAGQDVHYRNGKVFRENCPPGTEGAYGDMYVCEDGRNIWKAGGVCVLIDDSAPDGTCQLHSGGVAMGASPGRCSPWVTKTMCGLYANMCEWITTNNADTCSTNHNATNPEGCTCTIGGRFPYGCEKGLECKITQPGNPAVDLPHVGVCSQPIVNDTCEAFNNGPDPWKICGMTPGCVYDHVNGCQSEQVVVCKPVTCMMFCGHGWKRDSAGCETCNCAPAPCTCGEQCKMAGGYGTCQADNTCAQNMTKVQCNTSCTCGETCQMQGGNSGTCQTDNVTCAQNMMPVQCDNDTYPDKNCPPAQKGSGMVGICMMDPTCDVKGQCEAKGGMCCTAPCGGLTCVVPSNTSPCDAINPLKAMEAVKEMKCEAIPECNYVKGQCVPDTAQSDCLKRCDKSPCCATCQNGNEIMQDCPAPPMCPDGSTAQPKAGECCAGPQDCPAQSDCQKRCDKSPCCATCQNGMEIIQGCPAPPMCSDGSTAQRKAGECCAGPQDCPGSGQADCSSMGSSYAPCAGVCANAGQRCYNQIVSQSVEMLCECNIPADDSIDCNDWPVDLQWNKKQFKKAKKALKKAVKKVSKTQKKLDKVNIKKTSKIAKAKKLLLSAETKKTDLQAELDLMEKVDTAC